VSLVIEAFVAGGVSIQGPAPRLGFEASAKRIDPKTWRATIRFPRAGRWRLVVPNECAPGYMYPWPAARSVLVR